MKIGLKFRQFVMAGVLALMVGTLWEFSAILYMLLVFLSQLPEYLPPSVLFLMPPTFFATWFLLWCRKSGSVFLKTKDKRFIWKWRWDDFIVLTMTLLFSIAYKVFIGGSYSTQFIIILSLIEIFLYTILLWLCLPAKQEWRVDLARMIYILWIILVIPAWWGASL